MENKLTKLTPEDRSTLAELRSELLRINLNLLGNNSPPYPRDKPVKVHSQYMSPDIGDYIISAIDFLYGSGDDGTGYSWRNLFWERYGEQSVEHLTPAGKPVAVTGYRNEFKYSSFRSWSCPERLQTVYRHTETIEAINLRIDAVEKILSKYSYGIADYQRKMFGDLLEKIETP